jgi:hypothetical protein
MHVASIAFHYSLKVAASRYSNIWFKELSGILIRGLSRAAKFLKDLFYNLWIPQMVAFINYQFNRALRQGS